MKEETKIKLKKLAEKLEKKFGKDIVNVSNFLTIAKLESGLMGLNIHYVTIKNWQDELSKMIAECNNKLDDDFFNKMPADIEVEVVTEAPTFIYLEIAGKKFTYKLVGEVKEEEKVVVEKRNWTGLFDYNDPKNIIIRRGKYSGTNIGKKSSILEKFGNMPWFYKWCKGQIIRGAKVNFPDTERDMQTLTKIIKFIDEGMTYGK